MTIDRDDLKREKAEAFEWETNAIKRAVQHLLGTSLNNDNYRSKSITEIEQLVREAFKAEGVLDEARYKLQAARLLRKIRESDSSKNAILILGDYLLI